MRSKPTCVGMTKEIASAHALAVHVCGRRERGELNCIHGLLLPVRIALESWHVRFSTIYIYLVFSYQSPTLTRAPPVAISFLQWCDRLKSSHGNPEVETCPSRPIKPRRAESSPLSRVTGRQAGR